MKYSILLVNAFFAVALAQKSVVDNNKYKDIKNIAQENIHEHDGTFSYSFENGDGTRAQQNGQLKYVDQQNAGAAVQGGFSYQVSESKKPKNDIFWLHCFRVMMASHTACHTLLMRTVTDQSVTISPLHLPSQCKYLINLVYWSKFIACGFNVQIHHFSEIARAVEYLKSLPPRKEQ